MNNPQVFPAADTDNFDELVKRNRGTLIFIPGEEDYGAKRDELSDQPRPYGV